LLQFQAAAAIVRERRFEMPSLVVKLFCYHIENVDGFAEGLVDMHLTVGEMETKNFENTQNSLMRNQVPYYMKVHSLRVLRCCVGLQTAVNCSNFPVQLS
jgi:hypothetical protein